MMKPSKQFGTYVFVQIVAYGFEWAVFSIARAENLSLIFSNATAKFVALAIAFVLHRHFTFEATGEGVGRQGIMYFALFIFNTTAATSLLWLMRFVMPEPLAKLISDILLVAVSFVLARLYVFRSKKHSQHRTENSV